MPRLCKYFTRDIIVASVLLLTIVLMDLDLVACHQKTHHHHQDMDHSQNIQIDKEHISEHLEEEAQLNYDNMTDEELGFYYFKLHDLNNDTYLDGLELFKAIHHSYEHRLDEHATEYLEKHHKGKTFSSAEMNKMRANIDAWYISDLIDGVLNETDFNNDGYVNYMEFTKYYHRDK